MNSLSFRLLVCGTFLLLGVANAASLAYSYDPLNRLTNAAYSDGSRESYLLDPAGNRLSRITSAATIKVDTATPSVPTNVVSLAFTNSQLLIGWNRAFDTGGSALAGYQVFVNGSLTATTTSTNYLLTGLLPDTQYCLTVAAFDHSANISAASLPVCVTTPSWNDTQPPLIVVLSPTNNAVFFTNLVSITGTATDAVRGGSGIGGVTLNGLPANNGTASLSATSQWSLVISLVPGYNPFRVVAQDASTNLNQVTNDLMIIRAIPSNEPPAVVENSMLPGNQFAATLAGNLGTTYGVWASTNLADWILLTNVMFTNWVQQLVDMDAAYYLHRFYRFSTYGTSSLLTNGSFNEPIVPWGVSSNYPPGSNLLPGWSVGGSGGPVTLGINSGGFPAADGQQDLAFNSGDQAPGTWIAQTFSTAVGQQYSVTLYVGRTGNGGGDVSLQATVKSQTGDPLGQIQASPPSHGYGTVKELTFIATSATTTIEFLDTSSATVAVDILLDNIVVQSVSP